MHNAVIASGWMHKAMITSGCYGLSVPGSFIRPLDRSMGNQAAALMAAAYQFDRADVVADELLFDRPTGSGEPGGVVIESAALGAWAGAELAGVVVVSGRWIRVLAVHPSVRNQGLGSALLARAESMIAGAGHRRVRVMDQPGNYLAPGIDMRDIDTIAWLERRGYERRGTTCNLLVDVSTNPRVSPARAAFLAAACSGYHVRRARPGDAAAIAALGRAMPPGEFSPAWQLELERALDFRPRPQPGIQPMAEPSGVHVAMVHGSGEVAAVAAHDGNNRGLGWFGPAATHPDHRGRGLGAALLMACLVDVAAMGHPMCEIAWIGPRDFYERVAGVVGERRFITMTKELS